MEFICLIGDRLFSVKMRINLKKVYENLIVMWVEKVKEYFDWYIREICYCVLDDGLFRDYE